MNDSKIVHVVEELKLFIETGSKHQKYLLRKRSFSQDGKVSFSIIVLLLLNMLKRSLVLELNDFFLIAGEEKQFTKSAFSQARYKLKSVFFEDFNKTLITSYQGHYKENLKSYKGYYLQGVDGTKLYLPNQEQIQDHFGCGGNHHSRIAMGQSLFRYDLLNELVITAHLTPLSKGENTTSLLELSQVNKNVISIYDRCFPSVEFAYEHDYWGLCYLMRVKLGFNNVVKAFVESEQEQDIVKFIINKRALNRMKERGREPEENWIMVRLIRIELQDGSTEVLMTNLIDEYEWKLEDFDLLYDLRWGVETFIDRFKNKIKVEIFAGQKVEAIYQEFHAAVFVLNLQTVLLKDCEEHIEQISLRRKHNYKANRNVALGFMKHTILMIFIDNKEQSYKTIRKLQQKFIANLEPVRIGRSYKRKKKAQRKNGKYRTLTNYKPAI